MKRLPIAFLYIAIAIGAGLLLALIAYFLAYKPTEADVTLCLIFVLTVTLIVLFRFKGDRHE